MPITSVEKDPDNLTMTVTAEFGVPLRRLWDAYADPRQLERFWGPPTYPATFVRHDFAEGGRSDYYMTGPEGDKSAGFWEFIRVEELKSFEVRDGFSTDDGTPNDTMPSMRMVFSFEETPNGSRVTTATHFGSADELEQLLAMGMDEGMSQAMGQMDEVLADLASFAVGSGTQTQIISETLVRVSRVIRGSLDQVWRAHHDADLLRRWQLGPDDWRMVTCEVAEDVGDTYVFEWETDEGEHRFGFTGELLESASPYREVTTEQMIGTDGPRTTNELTLTPVEGGTLLSILITYPDAELRDQILATGMTDGMEASYARLEEEVLTAV
ncbi:ATPase [Aeromicrobium sp. PE09-221]|uniref:SRPBCC family protein n=1 Tax=Aeromicrobium sp. PE09-221 TaxID=1898043 RepID=UPI000B3EC1B9|nr:SRPBCC family protein [Aeromicrobium sp. PE09-221]OUZ11212.1 ATPase [Aeromicrobium sp. PE09-221]